jgi:hypothetical protein
MNPATGKDQAVGTAWLAMSPGFLLTAGHLLEGMRSGDTVRVRFPKGTPEAATIKHGPFVNDDLGVDVAILELDHQTFRQPLPMILTRMPEGDVVVTGYGKNLPNSQSHGFGEYIRPNIRNHRPANFLLQYKSKELSFQGFSGGAVYSLTSNAVVGIQIESSPSSDQVLAMPLSRIPEYWQDLTRIAQKGGGLCVVLTSSRANNRLLTDVIHPVLELLNLEVHESSLGQTTAKDLSMLERSTLVIADGTHVDASVMRELTIAQGLGTPDIMVSTDSRSGSGVGTNDAALTVDLEDLDAARRALMERVVTSLAVFDAVGELAVANPITRFFGAPLTRVSAANALALGYYKNFLSPVGRLLVQASAGLNVTIKRAGRRVRPQDFDGVHLHVVIPDKLLWASDKGIREKIVGRGDVVDAEVSAAHLSRPREMKAMRNRSKTGELILLDIFPTTMATMIDSIDDRLAGAQDGEVDQDAWEAIERKEIDRFARSLTRRINDDPYEVQGLEMADVCRVVTLAETFRDLHGIPAPPKPAGR